MDLGLTREQRAVREAFGDELTILTPGGGGFGAPLTRDGCSDQ